MAAIFREPPDGCRPAASPGTDGIVFKITADKTPPVDFADLRVKANGPASGRRPRATACSSNMSPALRRSLGVVYHPEVLQSAEGG